MRARVDVYRFVADLLLNWSERQINRSIRPPGLKSGWTLASVTHGDNPSCLFNWDIRGLTVADQQGFTGLRACAFAL